MEANICNPGIVFAASAAMQIGSALIKSGSDVSAYNKKIAAANANADAINRSTIFKYSTTGLQQQQIEDQSNIKEAQARMKLSGAVGEAAAAAGSGGVTGNSVRQLYRAFNVATGNDVMSIKADEEGQLDQAQSEKRADQQSAQNQILAIKEGLPDAPTASVMGNILGAALGVGDAFMKNTTPVTGAAATGGLFGNGGFLGIGRAFG